jgi:hypothetical protein
MKDLTKKLNKKIEKLESGKLELSEIEELVDSAKELYERLVVIRHKAYEKYGEPQVEDDSIPETEDETETKEEVVETAPTIEEDKAVETTEEVEEPSFDFSAGISEETAQPAFDFTAAEETNETPEVADDEEPSSEEEAPLLQKSDDFTVKSHEEEAETFPKADDVKTNTTDIFKESHVEKHEAEDSNTLNEKLKSGDEDQTLRKKLQKTPIADLKSEISIAKKFEYITFMFDGKNEVYEEAINSLNSCNDGEEAKNKLSEYSSKYNWDLENKSIMKFVELVERRYL